MDWSYPYFRKSSTVCASEQRTIFLLRYISDAVMRQEITAYINIVEEYHNFVK
ncbi:MAG: Tn3 family transposase [Nostoc sp. RI_552]|nr:Tn3 family transposase [Nostoc sp. RI_552]